MDRKIFWHRASALISAIFGLLVALFAMSARAKDPDEGATWKLGAIILAGAIGYVGFTGGKLVYPSNHYKDLNSLWTEMVGNIGGEDEAGEEEADLMTKTRATTQAPMMRRSDDEDQAGDSEAEENSEETVPSGQMSNTI